MVYAAMFVSVHTDAVSHDEFITAIHCLTGVRLCEQALAADKQALSKQVAQFSGQCTAAASQQAAIPLHSAELRVVEHNTRCGPVSQVRRLYPARSSRGCSLHALMLFGF